LGVGAAGGAVAGGEHRQQAISGVRLGAFTAALATGPGELVVSRVSERGVERRPIFGGEPGVDDHQTISVDTAPRETPGPQPGMSGRFVFRRTRRLAHPGGFVDQLAVDPL